jgi:hypothetical protein
VPAHGEHGDLDGIEHQDDLQRLGGEMVLLMREV